MAPIKLGRCASGSCFNEGTLNCAKCKVTFYCSKPCQKNHWAKHKLHCRAHTAMPSGTFPFLDLPRKIRDKIYDELVIARLSPSYQEKLDRLMASRDSDYPNFTRRNLIDELEERRAISPVFEFWGVRGFQPLIDSKGLVLSNKQVNKELMTTLFSKNTFAVRIEEDFRYHAAGHIFAFKIDFAWIACIKRLIISVWSPLDINHPDHSQGDAALKHNFNHIVKSLNNHAKNLESLKIRFTSCFQGNVELERRGIDALLHDRNAPPVQVLRNDGKYSVLTSHNVRKFYTSGFDLGEAFSALKVPLKNFQISGDLPGEVVRRLNRKFGTAVEAETTQTGSNDHGPRDEHGSRRRRQMPFWMPTVETRVALVDVVQSCVDKDPNDQWMRKLLDQCIGLAEQAKRMEGRTP